MSAPTPPATIPTQIPVQSGSAQSDKPYGKFIFAKTVFYFSLVSIAIFTLVNVILLQSKNGAEDELSLTLKTPEPETIIVTPTPISTLDTSNWNSEISAYLNVSFKYPPTWSQVLTQRDIIAHTTKEENPRGIWITIFDNPNNTSLKDWWNSQFIRSGVNLSDITIDNKEAISEVPNQIEENRETIKMYVKKDIEIFEVKIVILAGNDEDKEIAKLVVESLKFF